MSPKIPEFNFSMKRLNKAGSAFRHGEAIEEDYKVLNIWREQCSVELTDVRSQVDDILGTLDIDKKVALVSQRLKRLPTIISKLKHFPKMQLSTMQDIAGIRITFGDGVNLSRFLSRIQKEESGFKVVQDYIKTPAKSGYRGIHLVKTMDSKVKVELQVRTETQHAWATTVEISDVLFSSEGEYKRDYNISSDRSLFFKEVSKVMGMYERGETLNKDLVENVLALDKKIRLTESVIKFGRALEIVYDANKEDPNEVYRLLEIVPNGVNITHYRKNDTLKAIKKYTQIEKTGGQAVLVKVDDYESLKKAYPNYLGEATRFIDFISDLKQ